MRQPSITSSATLRTLVAALPDEALRPLILALLAGTPIVPATPIAESARRRDRAPVRRVRTTKPRRGGWPKGKPRKTIAAVAADVEAKRLRRNEQARLWARRKRAQVKEAATKTEHGNGQAGTRSGNGSAKPEITAARFWEHAKTLHGKRPWVAVARELGTNEAQALDAYRAGSLPPGMTANAIERFLELPAP